ncbi:hypothetical protein P8452_31297 [Trifolium repens]|nr:hypothetical protein P8452_31297 [Trifolium repens]
MLTTEESGADCVYEREGRESGGGLVIGNFREEIAVSKLREEIENSESEIRRPSHRVTFTAVSALFPDVIFSPYLHRNIATLGLSFSIKGFENLQSLFVFFRSVLKVEEILHFMIEEQIQGIDIFTLIKGNLREGGFID